MVREEEGGLDLIPEDLEHETIHDGNWEDVEGENEGEDEEGEDEEGEDEEEMEG